MFDALTTITADSGWDIFCLHYRLDAPVNSVINDNAVLEYQKIFDFLWRLKRTEFSLSASWTKDMNLGHMLQVRGWFLLELWMQFVDTPFGS